MLRFCHVFALFLAFFLPSLGLAQTKSAILIADRVELIDNNSLVADGNVEALYSTARLQARKITYLRRENRLVLDGPIRLSDGDTVTLLADEGELDSNLRNGLLRGARLVLDRRVQLAANRIDRVDGRYSQLYKVAATSCRVCGANTTPLWQIRAQRAIHDTEARQIYFDNAQLHILDIPILWVPRLRLPDPTLKRATGFLIPIARQRSALGFGIKAPYFIRIGDHRDLTLTPYIATNTRTLEWRYRQAFRSGRAQFDGAISDDNLNAGLRGYLFGAGNFDLPRDFKLDFSAKITSDRSYLSDYGYDDNDRLRSNLDIWRVRRDELISARLDLFQTLREGENNAEIPTMIGNVEYEKRLFPKFLGGELRFGVLAHGHERYSNSKRDFLRLNADMSWRNTWTLPFGLRGAVEIGASADRFKVLQDNSFAKDASQLTPRVAATLRWPFMRHTRSGATQIIEPVVMLGWTGMSDLNTPFDESERVEFDEGNLLSLSRFPTSDRKERGKSIAYGISWSHLSDGGLNANLTLGQILRDAPETDFSTSSGMSGARSDLLIGAQLSLGKDLGLTSRGLFNDSGKLTKLEARGAFSRSGKRLGLSYVWLDADPAENRPDIVAEWAIEGSYRIAKHWTTSADWRYDYESGRTTRAGLGLSYRNECVDVAVSVSRRFTSSTIVEPVTDFGITVELLGFTAKGFDDSYTRACRN